MRNYRRKWVKDLVEEAEKAAKNGRMKTVYEIKGTISNEKRKTQNAKDKDEYLKTRSKEYFEEVLMEKTLITLLTISRNAKQLKE